MQSLDISKLKFIRTHCDLCGLDETRPCQSVSFWGMKFYFVRCQNCGLVYQNPLCDKDSRNHIYEAIEYWNHRDAGALGANHSMINYYSYLDEAHHRTLTNAVRIKWIKSILPQNSRILDIGCSDGLFVHDLSKAGYRALGMDISFTILSNGHKANIIKADFEKDWPLKNTFDAITCFATFSNFTKPSSILAQANSFLKPGGHFFFNYGDYDRLLCRSLGSLLYLFRLTVAIIYSTKTIKRYFKENGFAIEDITSDIQVVPLARLLGFFRVLPLSKKLITALGIERIKFKIPLPTGYAACAIKK